VLQLVPGYSGLGVLASRQLLAERPRLRAAFDRLMAPDFLYQHAKRLERVHMVLHMSFVDQKRELRETNRRLQRFEAQLAAAPATTTPSRPKPPTAVPEALTQPVVHRPLPLRVAFVGSLRLAALIEPSCEAVLRVPEQWDSVTAPVNPDLLLVETPGEDDLSLWSHEALTEPCGPLSQLLALCRQNHVPSALWATVDYRSVEPFVATAPLFDQRFVADYESAAVLANAVPGELPPGVLPWAQQPELHRTPEGNERDGRPLYVGGWRASWPAPSQRVLRTLLDAALPHGLRIAVPVGARAEFPREYAGAVEEAGVDLTREIELMQRAPIVISFHPAIEAKTFVARTVFEAVACGAAVIGHPNWGMHHYFGDTTGRAAGSVEAEEQYALLLTDEAARHERVRTAQAVLARAHTYDHRLATILSSFGRRLVPQPELHPV
jgi:hypothetical protein